MSWFNWLLPKKKGSLTYIEGDATKPIGTGIKYIIHCCNDVGGWGAGFVLALSRKWKDPESDYRYWASNTKDFKLGNVRFVQVEKDIKVVNMIGQHGTGPDSVGNPPIRYVAIKQCLKKVAEHCKENNASVHAPKFGSDLAGGDWKLIEKMIKEELINKGIDVTIYEWVG